MKFISTKTYGHEIGLSCCFRQWRADSHCSKLHGYALAFRFEFEANMLDERNWVVDFGGLKELKAELAATFDHKTLVADDDPQLRLFIAMHEEGLLDLVQVRAVGCEAFAVLAMAMAAAWLTKQKLGDRVRVRSVECREHGANSAIAERT